MSLLIEMAQQYATKCHKDTNHLYDGRPYEFHLEMVVWFAMKYIDLIPIKDRPLVFAACWCHDVIEDTRQTYSDVAEELGDKVADIVYALTNEKGKNRKQRASRMYYEGIRNTKYADFVKICDRLANIKYSTDAYSRMADLYREEYYSFLHELHRSLYEDMFLEMEQLMSITPTR